MTVLTTLGVVVALAAAVRSTWSPCGLSMLSSVTPLAERSKGQRYAVTSAWFVAGATLGGATLGLGVVAAQRLVSLLDPSRGAALAVVALAAAVAAASDARLGGFRLPGHTRQVNELWLRRYRGWVYGVGFGWQIGVGLATYIVTAGVYLLIVAGALEAHAATAFALATLFGLVRGLAVWCSARVHTTEQLYALHRRFDAAREPVRWAVVAVQAAVALAAAGAVAPAFAGVLGAVMVAGALVAAAAGRGGRRAGVPRGAPAAIGR